MPFPPKSEDEDKKDPKAPPFGKAEPKAPPFGKAEPGADADTGAKEKTAPTNGAKEKTAPQSGGQSAPEVKGQGEPDVKPHDQPGAKKEPEESPQSKAEASTKEGNLGKAAAQAKPTGLPSIASMTKEQALKESPKDLNTKNNSGDHMTQLMAIVEALALMVMAQKGPAPAAGASTQQKPGQPGMVQPKPGMPGQPMARPGAPTPQGALPGKPGPGQPAMPAGGPTIAPMPRINMEQFGSVMQIVQAANSGQLPRAGAAILVAAMTGLSEEQAKALVTPDAAPATAAPAPLSALTPEEDAELIEEDDEPFAMNPEEEELEEGEEFQDPEEEEEDEQLLDPEEDEEIDDAYFEDPRRDSFEEQPRDEHGRWADEGGGAGGSYKASPFTERALIERDITSGSKGIPREQMPQIPKDAMPEFFDRLKSKGVEVNSGKAKVGDLKPTQSSMNVPKVMAMRSMPKEKLSKPVIVSSDGHILDGHHRWAALKINDPGAEIATVNVGMPIEHLVNEARGFDKVKYKTVNDAVDHFDYDPEQPRDDLGRFGEGGGGGRSKGDRRIALGRAEKEFDRAATAYHKALRSGLDKKASQPYLEKMEFARAIRSALREGDDPDKAVQKFKDDLIKRTLPKHLRKTFEMIAVRRDYDDDQPRAEDGKWTSGGGGGGRSPDDVDRKLTGAGASKRANPKPKEPSAGLKAVASRMKGQFRDVDKGKLPQDHSKYFKQREGSSTVSVDKLKINTGRQGARERAEANMSKALSGGPKRDPILVSKNDDGTFNVIDGNHTVEVAKAQGWKDVPVKVVDRPTISPNYYTDEESARMKETSKGRLDKLTDRLGHDVDEQVKIAETTLAKHQAELPRALARFTNVVGGEGVEISGRSKDIGSALQKVASKAEDAIAKGKPIKYKSVADLQDGTGMRAVIPSKNGGDTIAELKARAADLESRYEIVGKDNYVDKPQSGGYRAIHYIVKDKDGLEKEVQLQTRRQQNFQTWSHDVYKPVTELQRKVQKEHKDVIAKYSDKVSEYLYNKDLGKDPGDFKETLPEQVLAAFGAPRLDWAR